MPVWGRLQGPEERCQGWGTHKADMMSMSISVSHSHGAKPNSQSSKKAYVTAKPGEMGVKLHILFLQAWRSVVHPLPLHEDKKLPLQLEGSFSKGGHLWPQNALLGYTFIKLGMAVHNG